MFPCAFGATFSQHRVERRRVFAPFMLPEAFLWHMRGGGLPFRQQLKTPMAPTEPIFCVSWGAAYLSVHALLPTIDCLSPGVFSCTVGAAWVLRTPPHHLPET